MVQYRVYDDAGLEYYNPCATYWKLQNHIKTCEAGHARGTASARKSRIEDVLIRLGIPVDNRASAARLSLLASRADRGLLVYDTISESKLQGFALSRHLAGDTWATTFRKESLIRMLETADDSAIFPIGNLPAELRVAIYEYHLQGLDTQEGAPTRWFEVPHNSMAQPPITKVSKDVRQESLPLFYKTAVFHLYLKFEVHNGILLSIDRMADRFFKSQDLLSKIRTLRVHVEMTSEFTHLKARYGLDCNFAVSANGTL